MLDVRYHYDSPYDSHVTAAVVDDFYFSEMFAARNSGDDIRSVRTAAYDVLEWFRLNGHRYSPDDARSLAQARRDAGRYFAGPVIYTIFGQLFLSWALKFALEVLIPWLLSYDVAAVDYRSSIWKV